LRPTDLLAFAWTVVTGYRTRTALILVAMGIGVAAVVVVSSLGEGARRYVLDQFGALGTNLIIVLPGRAETAGAMPGFIIGKTPRDLTLDDALALGRSRAVKLIAPLTVGAAEVHWGARMRESPVLGSTAELLEVRRMEIAHGAFIPAGDPRHPPPVCVIGVKLRDELFGAREALGEWLRIGDRRFRVIGVMAPQAMSLGFNTDELVIVPVTAAQALFNTEALYRILVEAKSRVQVPDAKDDAIEILRERHEGERDVTVITQDAVLATFDRILRALTLAVGGIAAISLAVAGILIMNVMLVAVSQRTAEVGLLKAIGARQAQITAIFLAEAILLSIAGAAAGLALGYAASWLIGRIYPSLPVGAPVWAVLMAVGIAVASGVVFGLLPARRAARLDPVAALSGRK
jgi:putative ABC transport system permease protein